MRYEFETSCRAARAGIAVPTLDLAAIRNSATTRRPSQRRTFIAALVGVMSVCAVAAAAVYTTHVYVGTTGRVVLYAHSTTIKFKNATLADAQSAARQVDFPVVLPTGLPAGTRLTRVGRVDRSAIILGYDLPGAWRRSHHLLNLLLVDPAIVGGAHAAPADVRFMLESQQKSSPPVRWIAGCEEVIVALNNLTPAELARLQAAMRAAATASR